jgi:hypothetical protein
MILGDSHARECAAGAKHLLSSDFEVLGSINPGAGMKTIKDTASVKVQVTKKDAVVLWEGSNDIARNNSLVGLKHILEFLINANHTNVILLIAPHRHDLIINSCVNKEVEVFNKKLHKKVERFKKVEIIGVVNERNLYTRHGLHLNSAGKDSMSKRITTMIEHLFHSDKEPIRGELYKDEETDSPKHQASQDATSSDPEEAKNECSECNSATDAPDSLTVQDTEQKLTFKGPQISSSSDKEPKSGEWYKEAETDSLKHQATQDATSNNPKEATNECSECNSTTGAPDSLTVRDTEQKLTSKGPRTYSRQKKPPTTKNNDFLW